MAALVTFFTVLFKIWLAYLEAFYRLIFPRPRKNISGKVVLVTGAGQGIGKCLALQFAELGAKLALWDINEKGVQETAKEIAGKGGTAYAYKCDVGSYDDVKQAAARVRQNLDHVDILVNNAGIMLVKEFLNLTERDIRRTMDINTLAHFWTIKEFLPRMLEHDEGHIVTISSMAGKGGTPMLTEYCASKFAVFGLTEALRAEMTILLKKEGVKTTTVCPMFVNTNLIHGIADRATYCTGTDPIMEPEDVAAAIIDGVLRDKYEIYLPASAGGFDVFRGLLPKKALRAIADAIGTGFRPKTKAE